MNPLRIPTDGTSYPEIFAAILRERAYQQAKRPDSHANGHELPGWIAIMRAELHEAEMAWVKGDGAPANADSLREMLQVVATGIACLQQHGVVERRRLTASSTLCSSHLWEGVGDAGVPRHACILTRHRPQTRHVCTCGHTWMIEP